MKILLGVSGSISAYKTLDLARGLINKGFEVKVILTKGALKFVVPEVFKYLGALEVYHSDEDFSHKNVLHIELAKWCDQLVIAPLSANTLSRLVNGETSDLLSSVFLSIPSNKMISCFPAMNTNMLHHPFTQENINKLTKLSTLKNIFVSKTNSGILACGEEGEGKLPEVLEMLEIIPLLNVNFNHKKIVISTGATLSPLDPVRYLTNSSSGLTGYFLASEFLKNGFEVYVVAGLHATSKLELLFKHPHFHLERVGTVLQMKNSIERQISEAILYIGAAAISDIEFPEQNHKLKKEEFSGSLKILSAPDILASLVNRKLSHLKLVGFAAETNLSKEALLKKFKSKPVDLLIETAVNNGIKDPHLMTGFNHDKAHYRFMEKEIISFDGMLLKKDLALEIMTRLKL